MKLVKIEDEYYLLEENEFIQTRDWALRPDGVILRMTDEDMLNYLESESTATKKIIASTKKLDGIPKIKLFQLIELWGNCPITKETASKDYAKTQVIRNENLPEWDDKLEELISRHFISGYEKCEEINSDKKFTEEQIRQAIITTMVSGVIKTSADIDLLINDIKKEQTEWNVEVDLNIDEKGYINIMKINRNI